MNYQEYCDFGQSLYDEFAQKVQELLLLLIKPQENLHLAQIQCRAKSQQSLKKKLHDKSITLTESIEKHIKDLAGCRIIFYYNDDVNSFKGSGLLSDNFKVYYEQNKLFFPGDEDKQANDYYVGDHYVVEFAEERSSLPEYFKFNGLKCEVQVHTILNHAWAETNHNITYKSKNVKGYGKDLYKSIDNRLIKLMREYLLPAGYEFQKIQSDYERLEKGKDLFESDINNQLETATLNTTYELLDSFIQYNIQQYDHHDTLLSDVVEIIHTAINQSEKLHPEPIETPYGDFKGKTYSEIFAQIVDIFGIIQYYELPVSLELLMFMSEHVSSDKDREKLKKQASEFAKYRITILEKWGIQVQAELMKAIKGWGYESLVKYQTVLLGILESILSPSIEDAEYTDSDTVTFRQGNVPYSELLREIRSTAIDMLIRIYPHYESIHEEKSILALMENGCQTPHWGKYGEGLLQTILDDRLKVMTFYESLLKRIDYQNLQAIEEISLRYFWASEEVKKEKSWSEDVQESNSNLINGIIGFKNQVNAIEEFVIYKSLVGYQSVFDYRWETEELDWDYEEKYRGECVEQYINDINDNSWTEWNKIIIKCSYTDSFDLATFPVFGGFLEDLGQSKPKYAFKLLKGNPTIHERFITALFIGVLKSSQREAAIILLREFIAKRVSLPYCVRVFQYDSSLEISMIEHLSEVDVEDEFLQYEAISAVVATYNKSKKKYIDSIFLPSIKNLTTAGNTKWTTLRWFHKDTTGILSDLSVNHYEVILNNLVFAPQIDFSIESILIPLAKRSPKRVIGFFKRRAKDKKELDIDSRYTAIPFSLNRLKSPLSRRISVVVNEVYQWWDENPDLFQYTGGRLLQTIFSDFPKEFENHLLSMIIDPSESEMRFILSILLNYEGEDFLLQVCSVLITLVDVDNPLLSEIEFTLSKSGVTMGELGQAFAFEKKIEMVSPWLQSENDKIKKFAENFTRSLEKRIIAEKRSAKERVALRKLDYDSNHND